MKKILLSSAIVAMALGLVGCKEKEKTEDPTQEFAFREAQIELIEGESRRLVVNDGQKAKDYVWESSDTNVVVVANGEATAVWPGEAVITVKSGDRKAECKVIVKSYMDALTFPLAIVWDHTLLPGMKDTVIVRDEGKTTYTCQHVMFEIILMSEGLYFDNSGKLTGASKGVMATTYVHGLYDSVAKIQFVLGDWGIVPYEKYEDEKGVGPASWNEEVWKQHAEVAAKNYFALINGDESADVAAVKAAWKEMSNVCYAPMETYEYLTEDDGVESEGYYSSNCPDGALCEGVYELDSHQELTYMCAVPYYNIKAKYSDPNTFWGWAVEIPEDAKALSDCTWSWVDPIEVVYTAGEPAAEAKELKALNVPIIKRDCPAMAKEIENMLSTQTLRIRK